MGKSFGKLTDKLKESIKQQKMFFVGTAEEIKNSIGSDIDHSFLTYKKEAKEYGYEVKKISMKKKHIGFMKIENE
ncbi:MAG: hypothetical protein LBS64_04980 [Spirochaetaceae bacterium]|jgi:hypothetical protein|nr:hypothetical protein [Spirochaetaceae bacterium]